MKLIPVMTAGRKEEQEFWFSTQKDSCEAADVADTRVWSRGAALLLEWIRFGLDESGVSGLI